MAYMITEACITCGACYIECPLDAIGVDDGKFFIDASKCSECVGNYYGPRCKSVCPIDDAIVININLYEFN